MPPGDPALLPAAFFRDPHKTQENERMTSWKTNHLMKMHSISYQKLGDFPASHIGFPGDNL